MRVRSALVLAAAAALLPLATSVAAAASPSASPSAAPVVLTVGVTQDLDSANPFTGYSSLSYEIFALEYPTLTEYGAKDYSIVPGLADSWTESADHTTWTYKIHPGLTWSDGVPMTAHDAAYTFNRILNGEYEKTNYGSYVANLTKAEAVDDTTLVLTVSKPSPVMDHLYVFILPQHIWEKIDSKAVTTYANEGTPASPTVGVGPFVMVERQAGQFVRMKANPAFHRGAPKVDEVVFKIYKNEDALGQALKKGEVDFAEGLSSTVAGTLEGQNGITVVQAAPAQFNEIGINTGAALDSGKAIGDGSPLLRDVKLRRALNYAVDRQALVDKVLSGGGLPGSTVIPPLYSTWHADPTTVFGYDPEKAKALLDEAGYPVGSDGVRADAKGTRLSFRLLARSDDAGSMKSAEFVKSYFAAVGVETVIKPVAEDALTDIVGQGKYDLFEWGWGVEPDPNYMLSTFTCSARSYEDGGSIYANLSDSFWCDPAYDALFEQQGRQTDHAARQATVATMQQMVYDAAPYVVTYYRSNFEAYRSDRFTGFVPQPEQEGTLLFQWATWSYESVRPVTASADSGSSASSSAPLALGAVAAVVVAGVVMALVLASRRRAARADDAE